MYPKSCCFFDPYLRTRRLCFVYPCWSSRLWSLISIGLRLVCCVSRTPLKRVRSHRRRATDPWTPLGFDFGQRCHFDVFVVKGSWYLRNILFLSRPAVLSSQTDLVRFFKKRDAACTRRKKSALTLVRPRSEPFRFKSSSPLRRPACSGKGHTTVLEETRSSFSVNTACSTLCHSPCMQPFVRRQPFATAATAATIQRC